MNAVPNTIPERPMEPRDSGKRMFKQVNFYFRNPAAKSVRLIGEFNHWNALTHPMRRREDGWWFVEVPLTHGHHHYLFLVDDVPTLDPRATGTVEIKPFGRACVIAVS